MITYRIGILPVTCYFLNYNVETKNLMHTLHFNKQLLTCNPYYRNSTRWNHFFRKFQFDFSIHECKSRLRLPFPELRRSRRIFFLGSKMRVFPPHHSALKFHLWEKSSKRSEKSKKESFFDFVWICIATWECIVYTFYFNLNWEL